MNILLKSICFTAVAMFLAWGCASDEERKLSHFEKGKAYFEKQEFAAAEIEFKNAIQLDPTFLDAHLHLAKAQLKAGDLRGAYGAYASVVELDPHHGEALIQLATFNVLGKNHDRAREQLNVILGDDPNNIKALYLSAGLAGLENRPDEEAQIYQKIIGLDEGETRAYMGMANMLVRQQKMDQAAAYLKKAKTISPADTAPSLALVSLYTMQGSWGLAEKELDQVVEAHPADPGLRIARGRYFLGRGQNEAAEAAFLKAIELEPGKSTHYLAAAKFYEATHQLAKAETQYEAALAQQPDDVSVLSHLARFYLSSNDLEKAESYNTRILDQQADYLPALMIKGELLSLQRKWDDAVSVFETVTQQAPNNSKAHYFKALGHLAKGDTKIAQTELMKTLELNPKDHRAKLALAETYLKEGLFEEGEKMSKAVIADIPDSYQAHVLLGKAYLGLRQADRVGVVARRLIELQPENPHGYYQLGIVQRIQGKNNTALKSFEKALDLNPKLMDVFAQVIGLEVSQKKITQALARCDRHRDLLQDSPVHLAIIQNIKGRLFIAQNNTVDAEKAFQSAIEIYADYAPPYYGLAQLYAAQKQLDKAIGQYQALLEKNPKQSGPHMLLGTLFDLQKKSDLAETHYRAALEVNADFAPAANNLAYLLAEQGRELAEALALAQLAKRKIPEDPTIMDTLGWVYYQKGLYDFAIAELSSSVEKLPDNPMVHYHLGLAYHKKGNGNRAKQELSRALELAPDFNGAQIAKEILADL